MKNIMKWACGTVVSLLVIGIFVWMPCETPSDTGYRVSPDEKESPERFSEFLENCTLEERIALMQSLRGLKQKIGVNCYGKLEGLFAKDKYAEKEKDVTDDKQLLPKTYNDVSPTTVADAMAKGHLSEELVSSANIMSNMVWRRYNKLNYPWHQKSNLDYHKDYLVWAASKCGIEAKECNALSTFYLEQAVYKKKFADIWDKLSPEQREALLARIEGAGGRVGDKVAIVAMSGAAAISALSVTAACAGFAFYTSLTSAMAVAAGWVGVTLPFAAYASTTATVAVLTGPIGWCVAGGAAVAGGVALGWPDKDLVIAFVMTANAIKAKKMK